MTSSLPRRSVRHEQLAAHYQTYQKALKPVSGGGTTFVPGVGNVLSPLVLIGEAPGKEEDWQGKPFVGRSGALLDELLYLINMERDDVFITNVVKHWPPKFRGKQQPPDETSLSAGLALMRMELKILCPQVVVPLGACASKLWWPNPAMEHIAGEMYVKQGQVVVPMFHPAYALRQGNAKIKEMNKHIRTVKEVLDGQVSGAQGTSQENGKGLRRRDRTRQAR